MIKGSFLDGGANHPQVKSRIFFVLNSYLKLSLQIAAIPLLDPTRVEQERLALQRHFKLKRDHVLGRLERLGLKVHVYPHATFYIWLNLQSLPEPLNNGLVS